MSMITARRITMIVALVALSATTAAAQNPASTPPADNPLLKPYNTPFNVPPFAAIKNEHFLPAFEQGIKLHQAEIDAIVNRTEPATFENSVAAVDMSGIPLGEVSSVFFSLQSAATGPEIQAIAQKVAPLLAAHEDDISLNPKLFARVKAVYEKRDTLSLRPDQQFLLEKSYRDFVRSGALLDDAQKARLREINQELSVLSLKFGDNVLGETNESRVVITNKEDLAGLPPAVVAMGEATARQLEIPNAWVYTVQVPSMTPFLQYSEKRALREQLHRAYFMRGDRNNALDNKENALTIVALRGERARLLGYPTHAAFVLDENMAKTPDSVSSFLARLWEPALARAKGELAEMQAIVDREKGGFSIASWDWWSYAEKLRKEKYAFDDSELRPYFQLENVRKGIFILCDKLYGLRFKARKDMPVYHPEVQVYEVTEADGAHVGVLYMDFHPRASKRGGAWSGSFRREYYADGKRVPAVATIVCNFTRPTSDTPSLLSIDEVTTFFHEFGHALNTLLRDGRYRARNIPRDAIELPSQIMENWALEPDMLALYATHYKTGEAIPAEMIEKLKKSSLFNQGFETVEYLAASILDMNWHAVTDTKGIDVNEFESDAMARINLIPEIVPRYRTTYFSHIFSGGYSAGYYSYIWAAVLDADAFEAFKEKGLFDRSTATSFRKNVLEKLGTYDTMTLYKQFRGAEPKIEPLLKRRGLQADPK